MINIFGFIDSITDYLCHVHTWIPPDFQWEDLKRSPTFQTDLLVWGFAFSMVLIIGRHIWEQYIAIEIGRIYGLRERRLYAAKYVPVLEEQFTKGSRLPDRQVIEALSKRIDWTPRQVERWWRRRRLQDKPSEMSRFLETSWRALCYWFLFSYGVYILWDEAFTWDISECFYAYPHPVSYGITWYYVIEMGFYISQSFALCTDNQRKDFGEMVAHHASAIVLLLLSWSISFVRLACLVILCHDAVDPWLETAKLFIYTKQQSKADLIFIIFTLVWVVTRIIIFPYRFVYISAYAYGTRSFAWAVPSINLMFLGLAVLIILNFIWTYFIFRMLFLFVLKGKVEKDDRSETDLDDDEDDNLTTSNEAKGKEVVLSKGKKIESEGNMQRVLSLSNCVPKENGQLVNDGGLTNEKTLFCRRDMHNKGSNP